MQSLIETIESGFERRGELSSAGEVDELSDAVAQAIALLDSGEARVAEKESGGWRVNQWLKKAVLLSFRLSANEVIPGKHSNFFDKVPLKYSGFEQEDFDSAGVRVVPDAIVRKGAYVAPGVVLMPSYVNIGANIDSGTLVDTDPLEHVSHHLDSFSSSLSSTNFLFVISTMRFSAAIARPDSMASAARATPVPRSSAFPATISAPPAVSTTVSR